jgi:hypothetical protein
MQGMFFIGIQLKMSLFVESLHVVLLLADLGTEP